AVTIRSLQAAKTLASLRGEAKNRAVFLALCKQHRLPQPEVEYRISPDRKFRWDFAWPAQRVCLEVQGAVWTGGAHGRGSGIIRDQAKANIAAGRSWLCFYTTPKELCTVQTIEMIRLALVVAA